MPCIFKAITLSFFRRAETRAYCMYPLIDLDQRTKTCSDSKCYSDLRASIKTRGAVVLDGT
ncbi:hypothetical protein A8M32_07505 [Sinorhizobium alkalisoli]|uniref:Uncharacterized protein n=1 Tax=Sinorhizobium alkalisoli TaxID=1752398 RepID=A0A1E3VE24_9HYPH|nr:hypothetical protein A8M32_07505 [Sinorhizobium alkalisoli]